jgi:hypothetical protein
MAYAQPPGTMPQASAPSAMPGSRSDVEGVSNLKVAALLGLFSQLTIWVGFLLVYLIFTALTSTVSSFGTGTASTFPSWITPNIFYVSIALLAVGFVIGIVSYVFFYLGFRTVKRGAPDFGAPTTLVFIGLIGFLMEVAGIGIVVGTIVSAINSAVAGTVSSGSASLDIGAVFGGLALIGIGAILALIGVIGLILGNYRAGGRYQQSTLKIGAILTIIPFLSIVAYVLLLVGYMKAASKLQTGWVPAGPNFGGYPGGSPPPNWQNSPPPNWSQAPPPQPGQSPPPPPSG